MNAPYPIVLKQATPVAADPSCALPAHMYPWAGPSIPQVGGVNPTIYADFVNNSYIGGSANQATFAAWLSAIGGTFSRASPATYIRNGVVQTAAANVPRFPLGQGIRLTGAGTNLLQYSQQSAFWPQIACTATDNAGVAPDGTNTAILFTENSANSTHFMELAAGAALPVGTYTLSAFAEARTRTQFFLDTLNITNVRHGFDLSTGTMFSAGGGEADPTAAGMILLANGWYYCWMVFTSTAATSAAQNACALYMCESENASYQGDGSSGLYVWGVQLTATPFLCDYIPTTTATATQAADTLQWPFTQTVFSVLAETNNLNYDGTASQRIIGLVGPTPIFLSGPSSFGSYGSTSGLYITTSADNAASNNKEMFAGNASNSWITANGNVPTVSNTPLTATAPAIVYIGNDDGGNFCNGDYSQLAIWNGIVASPADMQRLTT